MASLRIILRNKKNSKGQCPLALRITQNRKSVFVYLDEYIFPEEWDDKKDKVKNRKDNNSARLNHYLETKLAEAQSLDLELKTTKSNYSALELKNKLVHTIIPQDFFQFADAQYDLIRKENYYRYSAEKAAINHFKTFVRNRTLEFDDLSYALLNRFRVHCLDKLNMSKRTVFNTLCVIRTVYNKAIKSGITDRTNYPFGEGGLRLKRPPSEKIGLSLEEVKKLENHQFENKLQNHAKSIFLFSFYFAGMRASDVLLLKWSDLKDGRLYYVMSKNDKPVSLKIPEKAISILEKYKTLKKQSDDTVFGEMNSSKNITDQEQLKKRLKKKIYKINGALKEMGRELGFLKPLTMHISRHSFASISGDKIPIQNLQLLYRHSSILTTIGYQNEFINKGADEALDSVLSY